MGPFQSPSELVRPERVGLRERSPLGVSPSFFLYYVQGSQPRWWRACVFSCAVLARSSSLSLASSRFTLIVGACRDRVSLCFSRRSPRSSTYCAKLSCSGWSSDVFRECRADDSLLLGTPLALWLPTNIPRQPVADSTSDPRNVAAGWGYSSLDRGW